MNRRVERMTRVAKVRVSFIFKPMLAAVLCFMAAGQPGVTQAAPPTGQIFHASQPLPSFDEVSIRRVNGNAPVGNIQVHADGIVMRGTPLNQIIPWAFGVASDSQFSGGPGWMESATFDIQAKVDEPRVTELGKLPPEERMDQMRAMTQELFEERFKLKVTFPMKEQTVYELTVAKGGLKCPKATIPAPAVSAPQPGFIPPPPPPLLPPPSMPESAHSAGGPPQVHLRFKAASMWLLAGILIHQPQLDGHLVVDKTGLDGAYQIDVTWSRDGSESSGPSMFTALQEQLGLKLVPTKAQVETLSVESVQMPSEN